jgi:hypothetical protein
MVVLGSAILLSTQGVAVHPVHLQLAPQPAQCHERSRYPCFGARA